MEAKKVPWGDLEMRDFEWKAPLCSFFRLDKAALISSSSLPFSSLLHALQPAITNTFPKTKKSLLPLFPSIPSNSNQPKQNPPRKPKNPNSFTMHLPISPALLLLSIASTLPNLIVASPASQPAAKALEERTPCYRASDCSWFYAAKCEQYCRNQGGQGVGVSRMEKCNLFNQKRCCCTR